MTDPAFLLGLIVIVALTLYALLGGADYGGGVWDLLASGRAAGRQRETIAHAIAPVWEANHVWLILVVTILFTAFPHAFASISVRLHVPLTLALIGIVLRGSAFVFRAYGPESTSFARWWGRIFAVASTVTPIFLGVAVGALTEGRLAPDNAAFAETYVEPWLTPFALSVGAFTLVLFAYLAAAYLTLEAKDAETSEAFRTRALAAGALTAVLAVTVLVMGGDLPHLRSGLTASRSALPLHAATAVSAITAFAALWTRRFWWARLAAATQVALIVWGWALAQYPYLVRPDVTIQSSAAPSSVLTMLLWILMLGGSVLIPSLVYLFRVFGPVERR